jgi:hypothetical protein
MDTPKPALRPPIQPPGLFYLMPCGLLTCDLECGEFEAFHDEVHKWQNNPLFKDRLWAAYGRFHAPSHQVQSSPSICFIFALRIHTLNLCQCEIVYILSRGMGEGSSNS